MNLPDEIQKKWKPRKRTAHKGDFGRVFILAGSKGLTGAAHLAAAGALRAGAGLVTLGVPDSIYEIAARREAEVMVRPFPSTHAGSFSTKARAAILKFLKTQDAFAIGPGLSQNKKTQKLVRRLLEENSKPAVIDADALNALCGYKNLAKLFGGRAVLTPHPGEFKQLFGPPLNENENIRLKRARETAKRFQAYVILKGHHTVVASPDGKIYVNETGNPGMAKGGTGDVLTGIVAALIGQGLSLWDSARFGVYIHGLAGDIAGQKKGPISMTATDLLGCLPAAFQRIKPAP